VLRCRTLPWAAVAALVAVAAACGDGPLPGNPPAVQAAAAGTRPEGALEIATDLSLQASTVSGAFETATGCRVVQRSAGSSADILAVEGPGIGPLVDQGAAAPLPADSGGAGEVIGPLADGLPGLVDGVRYAVPFAWGPDVIAYATTAFATPPAGGWATLFDPAYAGRIVVPDTVLEVATAAVVVGAGDPYALTPADLDAAGRLLARQRPLVREYLTSSADLAGLFASGRVVVAQTRVAVADALASDGVATELPAGATTGWSAWWVEAAHARHPACARLWLAFAADPLVQATLAATVGGAPASSRACEALGTNRCQALRLDDRALLSSISLARRPDLYDAWRATWFGARG
jgi:putative spermidine/putrescine transport system substrate-binding protein